MNTLIDENTETLDDLMCGLYVVQPKEGFRFSIDAVLLAHFAQIKRGAQTADFCSGSGVVALLSIAHNSPRKVICVEIQPEYAALISKSIEYNKLEDKMSVVCADIKQAYSFLGYESMDCVTCNPPYLKDGTGKSNDSLSLNIARREVAITLETAVSSAAKVLKNKGRFAMVHLASRAGEIFHTMEKYNLPVKRACMVQPEEGKEPNLILVEGIKNAESGVKWESTLNVYENGEYSHKIKEIYGIE